MPQPLRTALIVLFFLVCGVGIALAMTTQRHTGDDYVSHYTSAAATGAASGAETRKVSALVVGDSYTAGALKVTQGATFASQACDELEWACSFDAESGTGYYASGHAISTDYTAYGGRLAADKKAYTPDVIVVSGGRNDQAAKGAPRAAQTYYADLRAAFPAARIVAIAPFWSDDDPPSGLVKLRTAVRTGVQSVDGDYVDSSDWITPSMIDDDEVNLTQDGHDRLAVDLIAALKKLKITVATTQSAAVSSASASASG